MRSILFVYTMLTLEHGAPVSLSNQLGLASSLDEARQLIDGWNESGAEFAQSRPKWEIRGLIPRRIWPKTFEYKLISAYEVGYIKHIYGRGILPGFVVPSY